MTRQDLLLVQLMEECAEIQKLASKSLRFGLSDNHPEGPEKTNAILIHEEFMDLLGVIQMLRDEKMIIECDDPRLVKTKMEKVEKYLVYSKDAGRYL